MNIAATIQARMSSTRLPDKVLMEAAGRPILHQIVDRIGLSKKIDSIIVATTTNKKDDPIENFCKENDILCFRGSEDDVRGRVLKALMHYGADVNVEMYADNPCPDFELIDEMVDLYMSNSYDYLSNFIKTTYPPGLEVQVYGIQTLKKAALLNKEPKYKEHVSLGIYSNRDIFHCYNYEAPQDLRKYCGVHLELDTPEDYLLIKFIYENLYAKKHNFTTRDILALLDKNEEMKEINKGVSRRWEVFREK